MNFMANLLAGFAGIVAKGASTCTHWLFFDEPECPKSLL